MKTAGLTLRQTEGRESRDTLGVGCDGHGDLLGKSKEEVKADGGSWLGSFGDCTQPLSQEGWISAPGLTVYKT